MLALIARPADADADGQDGTESATGGAGDDDEGGPQGPDLFAAIREEPGVDGIVPPELAELMYRADKGGRRRILRSVYECGLFQTLREKLRCKEIWVHGAHKWRNPDLDLPADFEDRRAENYAKLRKPRDAAIFTGELIEEMDAELSALNDALPALEWLDISERKKGGAITLTPLEAAPEPRNLRKLKAAVRSRWGVVPLLDMLTETALRTGCLDALTPTGTRVDLPARELFERMLLVIYAYGTGAGIRSVAAGEHPYSEDDLRYAAVIRWPAQNRDGAGRGHKVPVPVVPRRCARACARRCTAPS